MNFIKDKLINPILFGDRYPIYKKNHSSVLNVPLTKMVATKLKSVFSNHNISN